MNILLFDVETTGLKPEKSFILSNGAIIYNTETKEISEFYEVLNWKKIFGNNFTIPEDVIKIHGITDEIMIKEGIHPLESMSNFYKFIIKNCNFVDVFVAFNIPFDLNMYVSNLKYLNEKYNVLKESVTPEEILYVNNTNILLESIIKDSSSNSFKSLFIDAMIIDQIFHFEHDGEKVKHNLDNVGNRYLLFPDENAHNAIADTRRMLEIFKFQIKEIKEKGLELNQIFEDRLIKKYDRNQAYWGKTKAQSLDYLARYMVAVK